jgi:hypothetical protein
MYIPTIDTRTRAVPVLDWLRAEMSDPARVSMADWRYPAPSWAFTIAGRVANSIFSFLHIEGADATMLE